MEQTTMVVKIEHSMPTRTRLRVGRRFREEGIMSALRAQVLAMPEVHSAEVNLVTGSILVLHEPMEAKRFEEVLPTQEPGDVPTPQWVSFLKYAVQVANVATLFFRLPLIPWLALTAIQYGLDYRDGKRISRTSLALTLLETVTRVRRRR
jgi:hypothetical protein